MAIESKDLRIGNLVLDPYGNEREVTGVRGDKVYLSRAANIDAIYPASELSPIPLNQEWLGRAGFYVLNTDNVLELSNTGNRISFDGQTLCCFDPTFGIGSGLIVYNPSLHQLQNLYFALTGTELEIAGK